MDTAQTQTEQHQPLEASRAGRIDGFVDRAQVAAEAFRGFEQEEVDEIVWATVVAGLESAYDLAELAMQETGFGVLEDKVVKNDIATEFLL